MSRYSLVKKTLIIVLALLVYFPAIQGEFIWDDDAYVFENSSLRSVSGLKDIWSNPDSSPQYYPLVFTSFWIEYHLWGVSPAGFHVTNLILHLLAGLLLWQCLVRLGVPSAWLAATIFILHPVQVESVAWIAERKNVLSLVFYLGAALLLIRFFNISKDHQTQQSKWPEYIAALVLFVAALLSKTVTLSLPATVLLLIWWKRGRFTLREVMMLVPFFVMGLGGGLTTAWLEHHHVGAEGIEWNYTLVERMLIAGRIIWFYAAKLLFPINLTFNYLRWSVNATVWWQYLYPVGVVAVWVCLWGCRHRFGRGPLTAVLFFCGTLFPALGFIDVYPFRYSFVADHFQYHASIGLIVLFTSAGARLLGNVPRKQASGAAACVVAGLALLTFYQTLDYKDVETLWRRTISKNPLSILANQSLGVMLLNRGEYDSALMYFRRVTENAPHITGAWNNLGTAYMRKGLLEDAESAFEKALEVATDNGTAHLNLADVYKNRGDLAQAMAHCERALELEPEHPKCLIQMGELLEMSGRSQEAVPWFEKALKNDPTSAEAHFFGAKSLIHQNKLKSALEQLTAALQIQPQYAEAHNQIGIVLSNQGSLSRAIVHFKKAIQLSPRFVEALANLALAYKREGLFHEAIKVNDRAIELAPSKPELHALRGGLCLAINRSDQAEASFQRALAIDATHERAKLGLGIAEAIQGKLDSAIGRFNDILEVHPDSADVWRNLCQAQWMAGKRDHARQSYKRLEAFDAAQADIVAGLIPELKSGKVANEKNLSDKE